MVLPPTLNRRLAGATFALGVLGCAGPAEVPDTPDLRELLSEYQQPSATLDKQTVTDAFASAPNIQTLAAGFTTVSAATPSINAANDKLERRSDSALRVQGSMRITLTCPGDGPEPTLDAAKNGSIVLTLGVEETRILRGIGATANQCLARPAFLGHSVRVSLDGPIAIDLGKNLGEGDGAIELLISLLGEVQLGDTVFRSINGRFTREGFESLFVLQDGSTIVLTAKGDGRVGVRDQQGFWNCSADTLECDLDSP
jgi:hypothetical protein